MSRRAMVTGMSAFVLSMAVCVSARAAVIYADIDAPGVTEDGTTWDTAYIDLQAALAGASSSDEIHVAQGTYLPGTVRTDTFQLPQDASVYGGYAGYGEADPDARDVAAYVTTLSGDIGAGGDASDNSYSVVTGANNAVIDGFTITGGNSSSDGGGCGPGGGGAGALSLCILFAAVMLRAGRRRTAGQLASGAAGARLSAGVRR